MRASLCLAVLLFAACHTARPAAAPAAPPHNEGTMSGAAPTLRASLQRTACYGWCPIYAVEIYSDGRVHYHGERFVKQTGDADGKITSDQLADLDAAFVAAGYLGMKDSYEDYQITDMPSAITSYAKDGVTKTVKHYYGDRSAPDALTKLESDIDRIVNIQQWIGTDDERRNRR
jgi:hypothetical protein